MLQGAVVTDGLTRRAALAGGVCLCCRPRPANAADLPFRQVLPGLYVRTGITADASAANQDAIANVSFLVGADGVAVFDPGGSLADGQATRRAVAAVTRQKVRWVILSHVHPDHVFGAAAFAADTPQVIGHYLLAEALAARGAFYQHTLAGMLGEAAGPVVLPTRLVHAPEQIDLGGRLLTLTAHPPAHTSCDLTALDHATGTLLAGDLLFVGRAPALDGSLAGWRTVLAGLGSAGFARAVPGHGPALVDWRAGAAPLAEYLAVLQREARAAVAAGVPMQVAARQVAVAQRPNWQLFDDYNGRNVLEAYKEVEWE